MKSKIIRFEFVLAAMVVAPIAANAADLPRPAYKAPPYVAPSVATWSGFYVGIQGGYGFGTSEWDGLGGADVEPKGFIAGGTIGYNLQTGSWVWGLEADIAWSNIKGDLACVGGACETALSLFGTARGRIGYAGWGNVLPYITGGAAFGSIETSSPLGSEKETKLGWTVGAGLEYAMWSSWSVKLEYLYADLGDFTCAVCVGDVTFDAHIVRAGLNYRF